MSDIYPRRMVLKTKELVRELNIVSLLYMNEFHKFHELVHKSNLFAWQPTTVLLPGESHGQRSLGGYSPWDCKESHMTEAT